MTTDHFKALGAELFGYGWQTRLAKALGMEGSTVRRWVSGAVPVAPSAISFLEMMASRQATRGAYLASIHSQKKPIDLRPQDDVRYEKLNVHRKFSDIDKPKPMPAVISNHAEGTLLLTDGKSDDLDPALGHLLVRHPDVFHLNAWLEVMKKSLHSPHFISSRHHHYSVIAFQSRSETALTYEISTHAGQLRKMTVDRVGTILTNEVYQIPGSGQVKLPTPSQEQS